MTTVGTRIELIHTTDEYTRLTPGTQGTVSFVDSVGTVHVNWDDGCTLGLIPGADTWKEIAAAPKALAYLDNAAGAAAWKGR